MTRNSNAHMRDGFVLAESDLVDFSSGSTDSAINFSGSADLHTPIHPPLVSTSAFIFFNLYVKPFRSLLIQRTPAGSSFRLPA